MEKTQPDCPRARSPKRRKKNSENDHNISGPQGTPYARILPALGLDDQVGSVESSSRSLHQPRSDQPAKDLQYGAGEHISDPRNVANMANNRLPQQENGERSSQTYLASDSSNNPPNASQNTPYTTTMGYLGNSGILSLFEPDSRIIASNEQGQNTYSSSTDTDLPPTELQQSFAETYFEYCWPWCPILDKKALWDKLDLSPSPLLINALALLGTQVRTPIMQHAKAIDYYNRAKMLFYTDYEDDPLVCLQAIMMFYWWAPRA